MLQHKLCMCKCFTFRHKFAIHQSLSLMTFRRTTMVFLLPTNLVERWLLPALTWMESAIALLRRVWMALHVAQYCLELQMKTPVLLLSPTAYSSASGVMRTVQKLQRMPGIWGPSLWMVRAPQHVSAACREGAATSSLSPDSPTSLFSSLNMTHNKLQMDRSVPSGMKLVLWKCKPGVSGSEWEREKYFLKNAVSFSLKYNLKTKRADTTKVRKWAVCYLGSQEREYQSIRGNCVAMT